MPLEFLENFLDKGRIILHNFLEVQHMILVCTCSVNIRFKWNEKQIFFGKLHFDYKALKTKPETSNLQNRFWITSCEWYCCILYKMLKRCKWFLRIFFSLEVLFCISDGRILSFNSWLISLHFDTRNIRSHSRKLEVFHFQLDVVSCCLFCSLNQLEQNTKKN